MQHRSLELQLTEDSMEYWDGLYSNDLGQR